MQIRTYIILVVLTLGFVTATYSQPKSYDINNGFALGGGITQFDIITDNFETKKGSGWLISVSATGDLPHKWYNISYNMQLSENNIEISGRMTDDVAGNEALEYKLFAAQIGLAIHVKLIGANLTLDLGPQLQYNGNLELKNEMQNSFFINGFDALGATDIEDVSRFNVNGMAGITAGFGPIKIRGQYIYGVTNIFKKLNDQNLAIGDDTKLKGNQSMMVLSAMFTF